ncbi:alpha/beta hydrolase [Luteibacter rhizovicinus DSM 16549]|uniref:Alpha/beta hydrolase n=1 Tax=Luteibacter rhizovicinus DSM 16549 TaxID=1440763 RepID=A0A0G9HBY2_9GAMM|nr:alpha/beta hydrolase [Luteibacter rhizovicinus]APG05933.1 alpha/beta hydrolase [Luteibacter rhizovicinus DSM 16549]KLD67118.1 alpha/beta hydrolase [Luteibacter rhizovicinus DSM 16549]
MSQKTAASADNQYVEAGGVRYAYRRFGKPGRTPLLCLQHFTGTLDNWDPAIVDAHAADREVILFENAGVGRSGGTVPSNIAGMAEHVLHFVDALALSKVHILGYSLGGFLAQEIAISRPGLIGRLILSGSAPEGGAGAGMDRPELLAIYTDAAILPPDKLKRLFFPATPAGLESADGFLARLATRTAEADLAPDPAVASSQLQAMISWANWQGDVGAKLEKITQPVLVTNGNNDTMIPTANTFTLATYLPNATLIIYPNAGHGALFQYAADYASHTRTFLAVD